MPSKRPLSGNALSQQQMQRSVVPAPVDIRDIVVQVAAAFDRVLGDQAAAAAPAVLVPRNAIIAAGALPLDAVVANGAPASPFRQQHSPPGCHLEDAASGDDDDGTSRPPSGISRAVVWDRCRQCHRCHDPARRCRCGACGNLHLSGNPCAAASQRAIPGLGANIHFRCRRSDQPADGEFTVCLPIAACSPVPVARTLAAAQPVDFRVCYSRQWQRCGVVVDIRRCELAIRHRCCPSVSRSTMHCGAEAISELAANIRSSPTVLPFGVCSAVACRRHWLQRSDVAARSCHRHCYWQIAYAGVGKVFIHDQDGGFDHTMRRQTDLGVIVRCMEQYRVPEPQLLELQCNAVAISCVQILHADGSDPYRRISQSAKGWSARTAARVICR